MAHFPGFFKDQTPVHFKYWADFEPAKASCTVQILRFILSTGLTLNLLKQAVQYIYRQFKAKRASTANKQ